MNVGDNVWLGARGGQIVKIDGDVVTLSHYEDKDYREYSWIQEYHKTYIEECIRQNKKDEEKRHKERIEKVNKAIISANTYVLVDGSVTHVTCQKCNAVIGYGESDKKPHFINDNIKTVTCKACGNDIRLH